MATQLWPRSDSSAIWLETQDSRSACKVQSLAMLYAQVQTVFNVVCATVIMTLHKDLGESQLNIQSISRDSQRANEQTRWGVRYCSQRIAGHYIDSIMFE